MGAKAMAEKRISCTFLGVGLDVHTPLLPRLSTIRACSYFSISSNQSTREALLTEQFEYKVYPVAAQLSLELHASPFKVLSVCGNHSETVSQDGRFFGLDTLYPAATSKQGVQGSMVLLKLQ